MRNEPRYITINNTKYTSFHLVIYLLTFFGYALFHAARKTFSNIKTTISEEWTGSCDISNTTCSPLKPDEIWNSRNFFGDKKESKIFLGVLDSLFLSAYAIGLFIAGMLGDRFNLRYVLSLGMVSTSILIFLFGVVSEWLGIYNKFWYISFWIINGFTQSTGWPAVVAVMGNWFGKSGRGLIFGIWSATASVGNILGALMVASVLKYGYHYAIILTSSTLFAGGIVVLFGLVPSPKDIGLPDPNLEEKKEETPHLIDESSENIETPLLTESKENNKAIGFLEACLLPGVIMYSLCYACLKMVNYSFLFWLPFFLSNKFSWSETLADKISIWYDIGGIFGGIIGGVISDLIKKRSIVIVALLTVAIPMLFMFSASTNSLTLNAILLTIVGFFVGGAANMISGTITADLGRQGPIQGNKEGLATVTGIVDGTGSIGAALGQILVPIIQEKFDWNFVFYFFIVLCILTNLCIIPLFVRESLELYRAFRDKKKYGQSYRPVNTINDDDYNGVNSD